MTDAEKLLKLKTDIEKSKIEKAQIEGKLQSYQEQLKKDFGCNSVEEAEITIKKISEEIESDEKIFETGMEELKDLL